MKLEEYNRMKKLLGRLTGQQPCSISEKEENVLKENFKDTFEIGFSQFNELMLIFGFNRVSRNFFQFLVDYQLNIDSEKTRLEGLDELEEGVNRFLSIALLFFGNVKHAFNLLSRDVRAFDFYLSSTAEIPSEAYTKRNTPIIEILEVSPEETYYLGNLVQKNIYERVEKNSDDAEAQMLLEKVKQITPIGNRNQNAYLASDHLDVYVATSMREKHEFSYVNKVAKKIFHDSDLSQFNLRYFNPTQAFSPTRVDKGLSEALMLKRAKCTIYLVQEKETLGKDSELASTLAQGKPVIALIPNINNEYVNELIDDLIKYNPNEPLEQILLNQIKMVNPKLAWESAKIAEWIQNPNKSNSKELKDILEGELKNHYNKQEEILKDDHPLGIQVNLATGVANGLLVTRSIEECSELVRKIVTKSLEFSLCFEKMSDNDYIVLREKITNCIYRIITSNKLLTNSFWNFYFENDSKDLKIEYKNSIVH